MTNTTYVNDVITETRIEATECGVCGVIFGLGAAFKKKRLDDSRWFFCPNGHEIHWTGQSEADKLRKQLQNVREQKDDLYESLTAARQLARTELRRAAAYRGHATRLRNRIAQGLCPAGCDQAFPDVEQHIATEHPDFKLPGAGD